MWRQANIRLSAIRRVPPVAVSGKRIGMHSLKIGQQHSNQAIREKALSWMEMKVDTVYGPQWTHPHPSFSPDEIAVVYTSDVSGHSQIYVAMIP